MGSESSDFRDALGADSWFSFVAEHEDAMYRRCAEEPSSTLLELFCLVAESENGGAIQYLMNSSGDGFARLHRCFEVVHWPTGAQWLALIRAQFTGGQVPEDRDQRIDAITAIAGEELTFDPFETASTLLNTDMPELEAAIEGYVIANKEYFSRIRQESDIQKVGQTTSSGQSL